MFTYAFPSLVIEIEPSAARTVAIVIVSISRCTGGTGITDNVIVVEYLVIPGASALVSSTTPVRWLQGTGAAVARPILLAEEQGGAGALAFAVYEGGFVRASLAGVVVFVQGKVGRAEAATALLDGVRGARHARLGVVVKYCARFTWRYFL